MKGLTLTQKEQTRLRTFNLILEGHIGVGQAANLLGLSERHTWRILASYRKEGVTAMAHGNRGCHPANRIPEATRQQITALAQSRYARVNHTHLVELLAEREGISLSRSTLRNILVEAGLDSPRHHRPPRHRYRRQRMPQEGMLVQIDGSHHRWLEERGSYFTLLLAIDDATGKVPYALFQEEEDTQGYFRLMTGIIQKYGLPLAIYSDRHIVFRHPSHSGEAIDGPSAGSNKKTQFGRAMRDLGITQIFARSPEAKGRIERANGTFQDRLVTELRLAAVVTIEEANHVLEGFLPRFNERFAVPAAQTEPAYRPVIPSLDIEGVLCIKEKRRVAKDNTVSYCGRTLQLFPDTDRRSYAHAHVEVQARQDGRLLVSYKGKVLTPQEAPPLAATLRASAAALPYEYVAAEVYADDEEPKVPKQIGLGWGGDWYRDDTRKCQHRDLVMAGMERARQEGKQIGRPRVTERPGFTTLMKDVRERFSLGELSIRQAAKELGIGHATFKRLIGTGFQSSLPDTKRTLPHLSFENELTGVLY